MEKKRKHNFLIKSLILCDLQTYVFSFYAFLFFKSLPDAKLAEDVAEDFVCVDFANDGAEVVEGFADVL